LTRQSASCSPVPQSKWRKITPEEVNRLKRLAALLLLAAVTVLGLTPVARAHMTSIIAAPSLKGNELTVRALDVYGAPVPKAEVTAFVELAGGGKVKAVKLTEGPEGTYRANLNLPGTGLYLVKLELTYATELFRAQFRAEAGKGMGETLLPMQPIDPTRFSWGPIFYGAAVVVLVTATAVAVVRRRRGGDDEEEEE
jgi:hypothetical protein